MSLFDVLNLIGGLCLFLFGMTFMGQALERRAGSRLNSLLGKLTGNKWAGLLTGLGVTAIIQSSSATTVMVVGFVNSGLMTLKQSINVIMGANIGTTITAQIAALSSFNISTYMLALSFIGIFINMLSKNDKGKTIGFAIAGMGLLFLGLAYMKESMSGFSESETIRNALANVTNPFLLLIIGLLATALVQSSAAITTIIISMVGAGIAIGGVNGNGVLYVVLGTNIGTCLTALISSIGANTNAKRASFIHLMFNVFGTLIFMILLLAWPTFKASTFDTWFPGLPETQIAMFHTFFNVLCTLLFLPFPQMFVKLSHILIKEKENHKKKVELEFMDERMLEYPSVALGILSKVDLKKLREELLDKKLL